MQRQTETIRAPGPPSKSSQRARCLSDVDPRFRGAPPRIPVVTQDGEQIGLIRLPETGADVSGIPSQPAVDVGQPVALCVLRGDAQIALDPIKRSAVDPDQKCKNFFRYPLTRP